LRALDKESNLVLIPDKKKNNNTALPYVVVLPIKGNKPLTVQEEDSEIFQSFFFFQQSGEKHQFQ
jgi:hypothetical protein